MRANDRGKVNLFHEFFNTRQQIQIKIFETSTVSSEG